MELFTQRLILRPWKLSDAEHLYQYAKNPKIGPAAGWPVHTSTENSREIIQTVFAQEETYAVCLKTDHAAMGCAAISIGSQSNLNLPDDEGELGYWIGEPFWGQGLIPEACIELIRRSFEDLKLKRLWCGYFEGNEKSRRVQEKCGFVYHHTNKDIHWKLMNDIRTEHVCVLEPMRLGSGGGKEENYCIIRSLQRGEIARLKHFLYKAIFIPEGGNPPAKNIVEQPQMRVYTDGFGTRKGDNCLVADSGGQAVGAVWTRIMDDYGHIDDDTPSFAISLDKEYRGKGIGTELMKRMLGLLKAQGYTKSSLAVQKTNTAAVKMYGRVGFETVSEKESEYIMLCRL